MKINEKIENFEKRMRISYPIAMKVAPATAGVSLKVLLSLWRAGTK